MSDDTAHAPFDDFFALFEQPVGFQIDKRALDHRLRVLQKQYHPDNITGSARDQDVARASALINQAYDTLRHADSRAAYLLDIAGQGHNADHSISDLDFLDDAMEMRIALDEAISADDKATLQRLHPQIETRLDQQSQRFATAYHEQAWDTAIDATQKLKFLVKLDADVSEGIDRLSHDDHDDDDLYV